MKKTLQEIGEGFLLSLQFFTSIPIYRSIPLEPSTLKRAIQSFPIVGLLIGFLLLGLGYAFSQWTPFSPLAVAFLIFIASIVSTGGIHIDGWIDCSDAYFSYRDTDKRLDIMKDPRVGSFGVLSVILLLATKFFAMYETIVRLDIFDLSVMVSIPFLSRIGAGVLLVIGVPARQEGLATFFQKGIEKKDLSVYLIYVFVVSMIFFIALNESWIIYAILLFSVLLWIPFVYRWIHRQYGGITGDTIGAAIEGGETLLWIVLWLCAYYVTV